MPCSSPPPPLERAAQRLPDSGTTNGRQSHVPTPPLWVPPRCPVAHVVIPDGPTRPLHTATSIVEVKIRVLNVAGNRESKALGIGARVGRFLAEVFRQLGHTE